MGWVRDKCSLLDVIKIAITAGKNSLPLGNTTSALGVERTRCWGSCVGATS